MRFRDGHGRLSGDNLRMEHSKIGLAEAQVKSKVIVLAGKFAMQSGTVTVSNWYFLTRYPLLIIIMLTILFFAMSSRKWWARMCS